MNLIYKSGLVFIVLASLSVIAETDDCVMQYYESGDEKLTLYDIRKLCEPENIEHIEKSLPINKGVISQRVIKESRTEFEPYVITPHKINYFLPVISTNSINKNAYKTYDGYENNLEDIEAKFQLSLKVPLNNRSMFIEGDGLYLGMTLQAWWQLYADNISKPFRETNYKPEVFYLAPLAWKPFGGNTGFIVGLEHQSNGRAQNLSRSWNRIFGHFLFEKENFALSFRPWYRLKEDDKEYELDPDGDDNPDISDFMGHHELGMVYKWDNLQFSFINRRNFSTHKGAVEFGMTFPLWGKLKGYASAFNGYGESLIDYNYSQTRLAIGIALNDIF